nr:sulfur transferase domain-containing protein [Salipiger sp. PrR007]
MRNVATEGMMTVVNFRKADEIGGMALPEEHRVAEAVGLNYLHHPVSVEELDEEGVDNFRRSIDDLPQPVFLHCSSGARAGALALMALAAENGWDGVTALQYGGDRGLDLSKEKIADFVQAYADRKSGR